MTGRRVEAGALTALLLLACAACGSWGSTSLPAPASGATTPAQSASAALGSGRPPAQSAGSPTPTGDALPPVRHRISLPALMRERFRGSPIRLLEESGSTAAYRRWVVTYRSGDLTVSGVLYRPRGRGPFPAMVLAHGHIDASIYTPGRGLTREQIRLASAGYVVLHTDYRGLGLSDPAGEIDVETRLGYARDVINAVHAVRRLPYVDGARIGLLGRSMGGGVVQDVLVAKPGLVDAAVLYSSVSSDLVDNLRRWTFPERPDIAARMTARFGRPGSAGGFYAGLSPRTYFDRITEPVLLFHGTSDDSCPIAWSRTTQRLLRAAGVDSTLHVYPGEEHEFGPRWEDSIERSLRFLRAHFAG